MQDGDEEAIGSKMRRSDRSEVSAAAYGGRHSRSSDRCSASDRNRARSSRQLIDRYGSAREICYLKKKDDLGEIVTCSSVTLTRIGLICSIGGGSGRRATPVCGLVREAKGAGLGGLPRRTKCEASVRPMQRAGPFKACGHVAARVSAHEVSMVRERLDCFGLV
jgi:hypothetical protein